MWDVRCIGVLCVEGNAAKNAGRTLLPVTDYQSKSGCYLNSK